MFYILIEGEVKVSTTMCPGGRSDQYRTTFTFTNLAHISANPSTYTRILINLIC